MVKIKPKTHLYFVLVDEEPIFNIDLKYEIYTVEFKNLPANFIHEQLVNKINNYFIRNGKLGAVFINWDKNSNSKLIYGIGKELEGSNYQINIYDKTVKFIISKSGRDSPINLYDPGHNIALTGIWKNAIYTRLARTPGIEISYEKEGVKLIINDKKNLEKYIPEWVDKAIRDNIIEMLMIDGTKIKQNFLNGTDVPLFNPKREITIFPRVGLGSGFIEIDFRTKMSLNPHVNMKYLKKKFTNKFIRLILKSSIKNKIIFNYYVPFKKYSKLISIKGIRAFHFKNWLNDPTTAEINRAFKLLEDLGINIDQAKKNRLTNKAYEDGLILLETHFRAKKSKKMELYAFPSYVVPIITYQNIPFFKRIINVTNMSLNELYGNFVGIKTELKAGIFNTIINYLKEVLKDLDVLLGKQLKSINLTGPLKKSYVRNNLDKWLIEERRKDFEIINLPKLPIKIRKGEQKKPFEIESGSILNLLTSGENLDKKTDDDYVSIRTNDLDDSFEIIKVWNSAKFPKPLRIGIISPEYHTNPTGPEETAVPRYEIIEGILTGDFNLIDPKSQKRKSKQSPIKNLEKVLNRMYKFFDYNPSNIEVKQFILPDVDITIDEVKGEISPYKQEFNNALKWGADLFIMILPNRRKHRLTKYEKDFIYNWGFKFAKMYNKQIIHFRFNSFIRNSTFYAMCYSLFTHLISKFRGKIFNVDLNNEFFNNYENPGFIFYDFAGVERGTVGIIIAGDGGISKAKAHITKPSSNKNDALRNLGTHLKNLINENGWDLLIIMRDSYYQYKEKQHIKEIQKNLNIDLLAYNVLKRDKLTGVVLSKKYRSEYYKPKSPSKTGLITPDEAVHLFPHETELTYGIPRAVKFKLEWSSPEIRNTPEDIIYLGTYLAKLTENQVFPHRQKIPTFIHLSDKLSELIDAGTFQNNDGTEINLSFFI